MNPLAVLARVAMRAYRRLRPSRVERERHRVAKAAILDRLVSEIAALPSPLDDMEIVAIAMNTFSRTTAVDRKFRDAS